VTYLEKNPPGKGSPDNTHLVFGINVTAPLLVPKEMKPQIPQSDMRVNSF
jgi:hypothetical protein